MFSRWAVAAVALLLVLCTVSVVGAETNLIKNADFTAGTYGDGIPLHWVSFARSDAADFSLSSERALSADVSLKIVDESTNQSVGLRSDPVKAQAGNVYVAEVDVYVESGSAMLYLDFHQSSGARIDAKTAIVSTTGSWETLRVEAQAPPGTETITIILYSSIPNVGTAYFDNARLFDVSQRPIALEERAPISRELGFLPADGDMVTVNPPPFVWLPTPRAKHYTVEYSRDASFAVAHRVEDVTLPLYVADHTLEPGTWYWRYAAITDDGQVVGPSPARSFVVSADLPQLPLPPAHVWQARIPNEHPRLFVRPEGVQALRDRLNLRAVPALFPNARLAALAGAELPPEPTSPYASGALDIDVWREGVAAMNPVMDTMEQLAFLYLLTEDVMYAREGKKMLLHFAGMDPRGATSYAGSPEVAMRLLYLMPRAYTWLYDTLTEAERDVVRASAIVRGQDAYARIKNLPFETSPYSSHPGRMLGFLGQLSIAFWDEIPQARDWLEYVVQLMYGVYPAWGGADGGYAEGHNYWRAYMSWMFDFVDALYVAADLNLYEKPFFQNTGYFALYGRSIGTWQPFGDGQNGGTGHADAAVMTHLARMQNNGHFTWYVNQIGGTTARTNVQALLLNDPLPAAVAPVDLPDARWFTDVGWVTLHRDLANPKDNVQFTFKASPFGSASHSHSEQNAFVIHGYGEALAISSGYYPWHRSPHHEQWTNQTLSKNTLLIDGRGQPIFDMDASGQILGLFHSDMYDYTAGEAAQAYRYAPLQRFTRHIVYVRPDMYLIVDDVRASRPVTVDWLLHSRSPITWQAESQTVRVAGRTAYLDAHLLAPAGMVGVVTDGFTPRPEDPGTLNEWHLRASLPSAARETAIVALVIPQRAGAADWELMDAQAVTTGNMVEVTIQTKQEGRIITEHIVLQLPAAETGGLAQVMAQGMTDDGEPVRAFIYGNNLTSVVASNNADVAAAVAWDAATASITLQVGRPEAAAQRVPLVGNGNTMFTVTAPFAPDVVTLNGNTLPAVYDEEAGTVTVTF